MIERQKFFKQLNSEEGSVVPLLIGGSVVGVIALLTYIETRFGERIGRMKEQRRERDGANFVSLDERLEINNLNEDIRDVEGK